MWRSEEGETLYWNFDTQQWQKEPPALVVAGVRMVVTDVDWEEKTITVRTEQP